MTTTITGDSVDTGTVTADSVEVAIPYFLAQGPQSDQNIAQFTTVPYENVIYNSGGHYNSTTSTFTAPVTGLYSFSWDVWHSSASTGRCFIQINNSNVKAPGFTSTQGLHTRLGTTATDEDSSKTVILELVAGDTVRIYNGDNSNTVRIFYSSSFSGYLITKL